MMFLDRMQTERTAMTDQTKTQSRAVEDFLKAVYALQQNLPETERVSTNALKDVLKISAPSVTDMAQRLVEGRLIDYEKYYGVRLTEEGCTIALRIIRRHRLIELYLVKELGYALQEVHEDAEQLEHAVSDRFIEAIADKLNNPEFDPHGDPIPAADGTMTIRDLQPLSELPLNTPARIGQLASDNQEMLQYMMDKGFALNQSVMVIERDPFEGPVTIKLDNRRTVIGHQVATAILAEVIEK
jgi:DtxR family transcriptional regulator, Mn-dependent transcriptional regulator